MSISTKAGAAAVAATLALGLPAAATAQAGPAGDRNVPSRIATKLKAADRALDRAQERADDGESAGAATSLASVRKNLASALKSAQRRITNDGGRTGVASASALARTDDQVADGTSALLDGADATVTDAAVTTLDAALDNRDAVIAAIAALDADAKAEYSRVLARIADDADDETEDINEALSDDTLTDSGRAALQAALTQIAATKTAAAAQVASEDTDDDGYGTTEAGYGSGSAEDCPERGSGRRPDPGDDGPGTGSGYDQT
ncbi:MAG: hypothetical protein JHC95_02030 [Solirubrobacteraceae bacterium]|nr:hypothetical protein [Solirubrobacteraceae bacterium]